MGIVERRHIIAGRAGRPFDLVRGDFIRAMNAASYRLGVFPDELDDAAYEERARRVAEEEGIGIAFLADGGHHYTILNWGDEEAAHTLMDGRVVVVPGSTGWYRENVVRFA